MATIFRGKEEAGHVIGIVDVVIVKADVVTHTAGQENSPFNNGLNKEVIYLVNRHISRCLN